MAYLKILRGSQAAQRIELSNLPVLLGRSPDCQLVLDAGAVSRHHARITTHGDNKYLIEDLNSRNHTYVNSREITAPTLLRENDRIKICDHLITFHEAEEDGGSRSRLVIAEGEAGVTITSSVDVSSGTILATEVRPEVKLKAILEIINNLGRSLDVNELLPKTLDSLFKIFPQADRGFVLLNENGHLVPKAIKNRHESGDDSIRLSRTIVQQVMEQAKAILSDDAASDPRIDLSQSISEFRIHSVMCVPLVPKDQGPIGIIQVYTEDRRQKFTREDLEVLISVANTATIALENARLHQSLVDQARLQREVDLARDVQRGFLPSSCPRIPGYSFFAFYEAAHSVGGDYYGFMELPDDRLAISIADVSGKGMTAALIMARLSSDVRFAAISDPDPDGAVRRVNASICEADLEDKFVTFLLMVLDKNTGTLTIVNAGHMPPIVRHADGTIEQAGGECRGVPLNVLPEYEYESAEMVLEPGSTVLVYTDGVNEAMNRAGDLYGIGRLLHVFRAAPQDPRSAGEAVIESVREFAQGRHQSDDIALICFGRDASTP